MKKIYSHPTRKYMIVATVAALVLIAYGLLTLFTDYDKTLLSVIALVCACLLILYVILVANFRKRAIIKYLHNITGAEEFSENIMESVPLPMAVCSIDGSIRWYNKRFSNMFKDKTLEHESLEDCIKSLKWSDVLKHPNGKPLEEEIHNRLYSVRWSLMKDSIEPDKNGVHYSVFFYLKDITNEFELNKKYLEEKVDVCIINIDNLDEFYQKTDDETADASASRVRNAIVTWVRMSDALIKRIDRDKFYVYFEHQYLDGYLKDGFSVIETVNKIAEEIKFPISVSVGIGTGGNLIENEESARHALDLALGRGGGQACIKNNNEFKFYGVANTEYERSTRVKARSVAVALSDLIKHSDNVIFMGHTTADYDCFGAAVGLQRAVRELGAKPYIVHERISPAIEFMYSDLRGVPEYGGMFLDESEVVDYVTKDSLLVVLDTHRPSMVPCPRLLERAPKIVVIDHHRRSTEFISPCSLVYHEPYASSTCEMVTELLEYLNISNAITKLEAQCLYTGILMDTKNFILKTGVRTFEAASYLRKLGLDTASVRKMFSSNVEDYTRKAEIVSQSEIILEDFAVSATYQGHSNIKIIAAQAADEMLNLSHVKASVVVFPIDNGVGVSARSLGSINVQLIMEKLGGGGHMTVAGATISDISVEDGMDEVKNAIKTYLEERKG